MYLITGGTGTIGRPLVELLHGHPVRVLTRDPAHQNRPGVQYVTEPDFTGVTAVFLNPRAVGLRAGELLRDARRHGVRRVVVLAASNVDDPLDHQPSRFNGDRNKEVEAAAIASGLDWVSLRAATFAMSTAYSWAQQLRAGDTVRVPYPAAPEAPLHERDLADIAAHALTTGDLDGTTLVLTGPQSHTHQELIATIGHTLGRDLRCAAVPPAVAAARMVEHGHPQEFVSALMARYEREAGRPAHVSGDVAKVLGRARTYAEWVTDHADLFTRTGP